MRRDTKAIEHAAKLEAEFDGRPWLAMPSWDRARYVYRLQAAIAAYTQHEDSEVSQLRQALDAAKKEAKI